MEIILYMFGVGGVVASCLVLSTPEGVVRVGVLARDIMLCSWARLFTLKVPQKAKTNSKNNLTIIMIYCVI